MINLSKKLYISIFTVLLLLVVVGTATFAWFELNTNAWFDDMELQVTTGEGIKVSIDGVNFKYNLTKEDIKKAIVAKSKGYTMSPDGNYLNEDGVKTSASNFESDFSKVQITGLSSLDGETFYTRDEKKIELRSGQYASLDIFYMCDIPEQNEVRTVHFSTQEMRLDDGQIIPKSEIVTDESKGLIGFPSLLTGHFTMYDKLNGASVKYTHFESMSSQPKLIQDFKAYASDAMRFSVKTTINGVTSDQVKIYELNEGNGSYATDLSEKYYDGAIGAKYDKSKNAAHTYFNSVRGVDSDDEKYLAYEDIPDTFKGFDTVEGSTVLTLNEENNYGQNGECKATFTMWIDGWDADCFDAVYQQIVLLKFSFTSFANPNSPQKVTFKTKNPVTGQIVNEKVMNYYPNLPITTYDVVKDIYSTTPKKFKGWALEETPNTLYDLTKNRTKDITLVTLWSN